jgi:predicted enzyme related to lactoylglutathione lyase
MISGLAKVVVDVVDQDRAKRFWTEQVGFDVVQDTEAGNERWLEVRSPDGTILVLGRTAAGPGDRAGVRPELPTSNVLFECDDLGQTFAELSGRGVEFSQPPIELGFGWWSLFDDTEGNRFALVPRS